VDSHQQVNFLKLARQLAVQHRQRSRTSDANSHQQVNFLKLAGQLVVACKFVFRQNAHQLKHATQVDAMQKHYGITYFLHQSNVMCLYTKEKHKSNM